MERPQLRVIDNQEAREQSLPNFLSAAQEESLRKLESGFSDELLENEQPRWHSFFTDGVRDVKGNTWVVYRDMTREKSVNGWQVWRCLAGEDEFGWVPLDEVIITILPPWGEGDGWCATAQLLIHGEEQLNMIFDSVEDRSTARVFGVNQPIMEELRSRPRLVRAAGEISVDAALLQLV